MNYPFLFVHPNGEEVLQKSLPMDSLAGLAAGGQLTLRTLSREGVKHDVLRTFQVKSVTPEIAYFDGAVTATVDRVVVVVEDLPQPSG